MWMWNKLAVVNCSVSVVLIHYSCLREINWMRSVWNSWASFWVLSINSDLHSDGKHVYFAPSDERQDLNEHKVVYSSRFQGGTNIFRVLRLLLRLLCFDLAKPHIKSNTQSCFSKGDWTSYARVNTEKMISSLVWLFHLNCIKLDEVCVNFWATSWVMSVCNILSFTVSLSMSSLYLQRT